MEDTIDAGGGLLKIISAGGGDFNFNSLQFLAAGLTATGNQTLSVEGLLNGSPVGTDTYTKTDSGTYATELASVLSGTTLSELDITLTLGISAN